MTISRDTLLNRDVKELTHEDVSEMMELRKGFHDEALSILEDEFNHKGIITSPTIKRVMRRTEHHHRYKLLQYIDFKYRMTMVAFKNAFRIVWISDRVPEDEALLYFDKIGLGRILNAKERELYKSLPDTITIYRGCQKEEAKRVCKYHGVYYPYFHISWTLHRGVAEFLAFSGKHFCKEDGRVYSIRIRKEQMKGLFLERNEYEVIYPYSCLGNQKPYTLVTDKPTEYYIKYMNDKKHT